MLEQGLKGNLILYVELQTHDTRIAPNLLPPHRRNF